MGAPLCVEGAPSNGPYADRCTAPGLKGKPPIKPNDLCVNGCLFNVTADPTETTNLYSDPKFDSIVAALKGRLAILGDAGQ